MNPSHPTKARNGMRKHEPRRAFYISASSTAIPIITKQDLLNDQQDSQYVVQILYGNMENKALTLKIFELHADVMNKSCGTGGMVI
ncbi:hypothetical protein [Paenibacillus tyrfis]|uniref:hypothetical protein n=1 Tax=Paenibacillus tyrfis TaxID=1501230 RepID=UPI00209D5B41|nr:hypothetical protein [Paenibacillus tyrfis]MCP1312476.1 hypothetical protein [Paenibacillus tyrfis]